MDLEIQYKKETGEKPDLDYLLFDIDCNNSEDIAETQKELEIIYNYIDWLKEKLETYKNTEK